MQRVYERKQRMAAAQSLRDIKASEKQAKIDYLELRQQEVADLNDEIEDCLASLRGVLAHTLAVDDTINFDRLRPTEKFAPFEISPRLRSSSSPERVLHQPPPAWSTFIPHVARRHELQEKTATENYNKQLLAFNIQEIAKNFFREQERHEYDARKAAFYAAQSERNSEIDQFKADYFSHDRDALVTYCEMVLSRSEYPVNDFPQQFRLAFDPQNGTLAVEYDLPLISIVPATIEFRHIKSKDSIEPKVRKPADIQGIYRQLIAEIALRTMHELFEADQALAIQVLSFTGIIDTHDPATGHDTRVPVISVRAARDTFIMINLHRADPVACLRTLGAHISARPAELLAVKPVIEFNMVDKRFVLQGDALNELENRANLLELTPTQFEVLVANLFGKMGLETKLTCSSRDGGVDAVAFDIRPVLGGKVVIQAKRYKDTVGVSAVRDLYGTMLNEGANKGILVTTSKYGPDAYTFSADKPIELIDGSALLYLLREHADVHARIVPVS
ncbi:MULTISPECIES: restriction endonuclease [unclassified Janthinobacterium]|uniref:restriction endonuclease n=1 Tax=unclassified Janthinobacterium TaxID=2610881 RepID=UPI001839B8E5|nr:MULTISPECIES: restriction endonuclease [unclassified Janthinobacterium]MBB5609175.1 restriction system protein [Janthinobacterium sp. S3T4]MBB5614348.1 restriction system protein [Janthinobacterium sp. S3M3]